MSGCFSTKIFNIIDNDIVYDTVISKANTEKTQNFEQAKLWTLKASNSSKAGLQAENLEGGYIFNKSSIKIPVHYPNAKGKEHTI